MDAADFLFHSCPPVFSASCKTPCRMDTGYVQDGCKNFRACILQRIGRFTAEYAKGAEESRAHYSCGARGALCERQAGCCRSTVPSLRSGFRQKAPASLTPSERLKLSCQRTKYKPFTPGGSAIESATSKTAVSPQHFQNGSGRGQSQYSDVELMSIRQQNDSKTTAKCCHFDALY